MIKPYENREIDEKFKVLAEKMQGVQNNIELRIGDNHKSVTDSLSRIETQVAFTNGKVKKIILAIIGIAGVLIGLGIEQVGPFLSLLL